jgi:outer membrane protein OmpA-like peptidoglycan-associated protein
MTFFPRVIDVAPKVQPAAGGTQETVQSGVLFAFNSAALSPDAQPVLADVVSRLKGSRTASVTAVTT